MADGYGDDGGFAAWLTANGYTLPVGAASPAVLRLRGSTYVDGMYSARFSGVPTEYPQDRQWPRTGALYANTYAIPTDDIPVPVVEASYYAAYAEALSPGSLSVTVTAAGLVKRQKVEGAVEREFFAPGSELTAWQAMTPVMSAIEGMLSPFLKVDTSSDPFLLAIG